MQTDKIETICMNSLEANSVSKQVFSGAIFTVSFDAKIY